MPKSKTRLMHTCPTERPFYCITGDLSGEGFLVIIDESTHELVVREGAEAGTVSVIVNPKGVQVQGVSTRPGTRMLDLNASSADPMKQAGESIERLKSGAIGAPRADGAEERARTGGVRLFPIEFPLSKERETEDSQ
ncbi:MAG: hypothetical protein QOH49_601 [Acidobacteriota bacterium]|jgi:hypothetical protein|nr:hypothetical protein [Acidobacteriota bacterium]